MGPSKKALAIGRAIDQLKRRPLVRRMKLLASARINLVLDVGASHGQFGAQMRALGYAGRMVSFEPLAKSYASLERKMKRDRAWTGMRVALGARKQRTRINVSGDPRASSLLDMLPAHRRVASYFDVVDTEEIDVVTLDEITPGLIGNHDRVYLKIDAQGFEQQVLRGARRTLAGVTGVQLEMSLVPLYRGETLLPQMVTWMTRRGFTLRSLEYGFCDPRSGAMLQVDGIFYR